MSFAEKVIERVREPLSKVLVGIRRVTSYLSPKDDWLEALHKRVAVAGDPFLRPLGRPLVREKGTEDYIKTVPMGHDDVEVRLDEMYDRNVTSTYKYRVVGDSRQWSEGSWVYDPSNTDWQHHVYLFEGSEDGTTDIYGHKEPSVRNPVEHVSGGQEHGDPDGHLDDLFDSV